MARFNFSVDEFQEDYTSNFEPLPKGEYEMMLEDSEEKETAKGGVMIKAKFRVLGPTHANRVVFINYNVQNANSSVEETAKRQLATLSRACGCPNAGDTDELLNKPFIAALSVEPAKGNYSASNRIDGYRSVASGSPKVASDSPKVASAPAASAPKAAPAAASAPKAAPSERKAPWE